MKNHSPISVEALKHHGREMLVAKFAMKYTVKYEINEATIDRTGKKSSNLLNI